MTESQYTVFRTERGCGTLIWQFWSDVPTTSIRFLIFTSIQMNQTQKCGSFVKLTTFQRLVNCRLTKNCVTVSVTQADHP